MPTSITNAFVQQFDDTIRLLSQQTTSRLQSTVLDRGTITGESFTINNLGVVDELDEDLTRHGDTKWSDIDHSTRQAFMLDFFKAYPVDRADVAKLLANPTGAYTSRLMAAKNLRIDKMIYDALRGNALMKDGSTVALPAGQKIAHGGTGMTKAKIILARRLFRQNEMDEKSDEPQVLNMIYTAEMLEDILSDTTLTSADFMAVKMLQDGDISGKWMGFNWIPYERIYDDGSTRYTLAYTNTAVHFGTGFVEGDAAERKDKKNTMQVSMAASFGAGRQDEKKVIEIAFQ